MKSRTSSTGFSANICNQKIVLPESLNLDFKELLTLSLEACTLTMESVRSILDRGERAARLLFRTDQLESQGDQVEKRIIVRIFESDWDPLQKILLRDLTQEDGRHRGLCGPGLPSSQPDCDQATGVNVLSTRRCLPGMVVGSQRRGEPVRLRRLLAHDPLLEGGSPGIPVRHPGRGPRGRARDRNPARPLSHGSRNGGPHLRGRGGDGDRHDPVATPRVHLPGGCGRHRGCRAPATPTPPARPRQGGRLLGRHAPGRHPLRRDHLRVAWDGPTIEPLTTCSRWTRS